jgi:hypothetical protein
MLNMRVEDRVVTVGAEDCLGVRARVGVREPVVIRVQGVCCVSL